MKSKNTKVAVNKPVGVEGHKGMYLLPNSPNYYERPWINGKRTWRSLGTDDLNLAVQIFMSRRTNQLKSDNGLAESPYARAKCATVGDVIKLYLEDGCKDKQRQERNETTAEMEVIRSNMLLEWWENIPAKQVTRGNCDRYHDWRCEKIQRDGCSGDRSVDMELSTLNNAYIWAIRKEVIDFTPFVGGRIRYCQEKSVRHCRSVMPKDADEIHTLAREYFKDPGAQAIAWQMLFEAMTGLRTNEALALRMDAKDGEPGFVSPDVKLLHVRRSKGQEQVMPWVVISPVLKEALEAHKAWHEKYAPKNPFYFPSKKGGEWGRDPLCRSALVQKLHCTAGKLIGHNVTSHGMRAFYVTVRRSHGLSDSQIAAEIGHTSGGETIREVYGAVPLNWLNGGGPKMEFKPSVGDCAWKVFQESSNATEILPSNVAEVATHISPDGTHPMSSCSDCALPVSLAPCL